MGRGFSFRLLYRVVLFSFCLIFVCFYHGGGSEHDRREDKTEPNKLKNEFKGTAMKTLQSERIQKSPVLPFSTSSPSEINVKRKESTTISHSSETEWQNIGSKNISSLENQFFHQNGLRETAKRKTFASLTTQRLRNRREIDSKSEYTQEDLLMCNDLIIRKYDDDYKVRTDFLILYKNMVYDYTEYRVPNDSIKICNSCTDNYVRNIWKVRNKWVKAQVHRKSCKNFPLYIRQK
ncbi:Hypothetical predicted protein [Paramuricea clavata]|uniref:Uncharacterized protein n=1 Tax=Paramuricea clavata TaxID=317549 RepID=A0A6S7GTZ6_PARCT|nr:Hypothetical predicted protein [Paramuricea clavata]